MQIQLNNKSKINNPYDYLEDDSPHLIYKFHGEFNPEMLTNSESIQNPYLINQKSNFLRLVPILESMNLQFEYIWLISFKNEANHNSNVFVIKTNTNQEGLTIFWRRYMSRARGSGQNDILTVYADSKQKKQLTKWFLDYQ